jgi:hypothetical protein
LLPGSIAQWADTFTNLQQFGGGSWSVAYNQAQQTALQGIWNGGDTPERDVQVSIAWLKAFGAGAVAVSGPRSQETWKPFRHPTKFDGVLPVLWSADDVKIYQVPVSTTSLAHVMRESDLGQRAPSGPQDIAAVQMYIAALDSTASPPAMFRWDGDNRIHIRTTASPDQVVSIQVSYHPGWSAKANGVAKQLRKDGIGLMWLRPGCNGPCDIELNYDGGIELRICRYVSIAAFTILAVFFLWYSIRSIAAILRQRPTG